MKIIALDTATDACSVALWNDGEITAEVRLAPRQHAAMILPMVDDVLQKGGVDKSDLDYVAFGRGPGSFTGVRIAASIAQGMAFSLDVKLVPVSTLAALAQQAIEQNGADKVLSIIDARMGEIYFGAFEKNAEGFASPVGEEVVFPPLQLTHDATEGWCSVGSGWQTYASELQQVLGPSVNHIEPAYLPEARFMLRLALAAVSRGEALEPEFGLPVYLRDKVADTTAERALKKH